MRERSIVAALAVVIALLAPTGAYAYDARGRLVGACHLANGGVRRIEYLLDSANNRTNYRNLPVITVIPTNSSITSGDGRFQLAMQGDGNLVLYGPSGG